jgi:chromosome segregation ATPase
MPFEELSPEAQKAVEEMVAKLPDPQFEDCKKRAEEELKNYEKYFDEIEDMEYQIEFFKKLEQDVIDFELELKLARNKVKEGQFQIAEMYLEGLRTKLSDNWKRLGKKPEHLVRKVINKDLIERGISTAEKDRAKYIKKNPEHGMTIKEYLLNLKKDSDEIKKKGKDVSGLETKIKSLEEKINVTKNMTKEQAFSLFEEMILTAEKELINFTIPILY